MSGARRDTAGIDAGTTGSAAMGDHALGGAEVHGGLHSSGATGRSGEYGALAFNDQNRESQGTGEKAMNHLSGAADTARESAQNAAGRASEAASQARDRAMDAASTARDRVTGAVDRAGSMLEERGIVNAIRQNPLPALGIAFGVGFLLAGSDNTLAQNPRIRQTRNQLKGAVMGGVTAAVANEARALLGVQGNQGGTNLRAIFNQFVNQVVSNAQEAARGQGGSGGQGQGRGGSQQQGRGGSQGGTSSGSVHREPSHREL